MVEDQGRTEVVERLFAAGTPQREKLEFWVVYLTFVAVCLGFSGILTAGL